MALAAASGSGTKLCTRFWARVSEPASVNGLVRNLPTAMAGPVPVAILAIGIATFGERPPRISPAKLASLESGAASSAAYQPAPEPAPDASSAAV